MSDTETALGRLVGDAPRETEIVDLPGRLGRLGREAEDPPNQARVQVLTQSEVVSAQLRARRAALAKLKVLLGGEGTKIDADLLTKDTDARTVYAVCHQCELIAAAFRDPDSDAPWATADQLFQSTTIDERNALINLYDAVKERFSPLKDVKDYKDLAEVLVRLGEGDGDPKTFLQQYDFGSLVIIASTLVKMYGELQRVSSSSSSSLGEPSTSSTPSSTSTE